MMIGQNESMNYDISIIIVSWNTRDILRDCLTSIAKQTHKTHEVIVVDNASTDGTAAMAQSEFPDVKLILNDENKGFAAANNQGLDISTGRHVLLLNPDTIILDNAIDVITEWVDQNPDSGCVGCQVFEDENTIQQTCFADPGLLSIFLVELGLHRLAPHSRLLGWPEYRYWDRKTQRDVDVVSGMFMFVPRSVLEKVGSLDDAFFIYVEEADWCRRIRNAGYRCIFLPIARIVHLEGGSKSTEQIKSKMYVQKQKSKVIYIRKHNGIIGFYVAKTIFCIAMLIRLTLFAPVDLVKNDIRAKAHVRLALASLVFHVLGREPSS